MEQAWGGSEIRTRLPCTKPSPLLKLRIADEFGIAAVILVGMLANADVLYRETTLSVPAAGSSRVMATGSMFHGRFWGVRPAL